MSKKAEILVHLGEYIQLLQRLVPVDGRTLTDYRSDSASADRQVRESSYRKEKELLKIYKK